MLRRVLLLTIFFLSFNFFPQSVLAEIYKCPAKNGKLVFTEKRCSKGVVKQGHRWVSIDEHKKLLQKKRAMESASSNIKPSNSEGFLLLDILLESAYVNTDSLSSSDWWSLVKPMDEKAAELNADLADLDSQLDSAEIDSHEHYKKVSEAVESLKKIVKLQNAFGYHLEKEMVNDKAENEAFIREIESGL